MAKTNKNSNNKYFLQHKYCMMTASFLLGFSFYFLFKTIHLSKIIKGIANQKEQAAFERGVYDSCYTTAKKIEKNNKLSKKTKNTINDKQTRDYCLCMAKKMSESINWDTETFIDYPNIKYSNTTYSSKLTFKYIKKCMKEAEINKKTWWE